MGFYRKELDPSKPGGGKHLKVDVSGAKVEISDDAERINCCVFCLEAIRRVDQWRFPCPKVRRAHVTHLDCFAQYEATCAAHHVRYFRDELQFGEEVTQTVTVRAPKKPWCPICRDSCIIEPGMEMLTAIKTSNQRLFRERIKPVVAGYADVPLLAWLSDDAPDRPGVPRRTRRLNDREIEVANRQVLHDDWTNI